MNHGHDPAEGETTLKFQRTTFLKFIFTSKIALVSLGYAPINFHPLYPVS